MGMAAEQRESFTIHLCTATSLAELEAWFADAAAGAKAVYARGFTAPREHESFKYARALAEKGLVHLTSRRDPHDARLTLYEITKAGAAAAPVGRPVTGSSACGPRARKGGTARAQMKALLTLLRKVAERGEEMPSYAALAVTLELGRGARPRRRVQTLLQRLAREDRIAIIPGSAVRAPVVTILAAGRAQGMSTAETNDTKGEG